MPASEEKQTKSTTYGLYPLKFGGLVYRRSGLIHESISCWKRALQLNPQDAGAHNNLAVTLQAIGRFEEAINHCAKALELNPSMFEAHLNMGVSRKNMGQLQEAAKCYQNAIDLNSHYAPAHANLGVVLQDMSCLSEAEVSYRRALQLDPYLPEAHNNLAGTLRELGRLVEARDSYLAAISLRQGFLEAMLNLGHVLCNLDQLEEAFQWYKKTRESDQEQGICGLEAGVYQAILCWLRGEFDTCRHLLLASETVLKRSEVQLLGPQGYWLFLNALLNLRAGDQFNHVAQDSIPCNRQYQETLFVLGESHALSTLGCAVTYGSHGPLQCSVEWISGCKQWHLGNDKNNRYKFQFEAILARLPRESTILLLIGEIDCRHNEGILKAWKKCPEMRLEDVVNNTVANFVHYVKTVASRYNPPNLSGYNP